MIVAKEDWKMDCYHLTVFCAVLVLLLLQGIGANFEVPLPCYSGDNNNATLDDTIHLSDVVLAGRIMSVEEGEFGTYSAVISYYYSYKNDGLLQRIALWRTKVTNFMSEPPIGQVGMFFLHREPNMQLALLCMTFIPMLMQYNPEVSYEAILKHITEVGTNDTVRNAGFAVPYPDPCELDNHDCGAGAYCSIKNTLPQATTRCSCHTGFFRNHSTGLCQARTVEAAVSHCPHCSLGALCVQPTVNTKCSCARFRCGTVLQQPVCGSDGRSYAGRCQMKLEACRQQRNIHTLYNGRCRSSVPEPCLGLGQPLAVSSGLIQCLTSQNCPTQHFCHSTSYYSVCCPVGVQDPSSTPTVPTPSPTVPTPSSEATPTTEAKPTDISDCSSSASGDSGSGSGEMSDSESSGDGDTEHDSC